MARLTTITMSLFTALAVGCGGGGGGGDVSTGVRVLHGAVDAAPVDVYATGQIEPLVRGSAFAIASNYAALPEGPLSLSITRAMTPTTVVGSDTLTVQSGERYSVLVYGDNTTFGLRTRVLSDAVPVELSGNTALRVVDAATGAAAINVFVSAGRSSDPFASVSFGSASPYRAIAEGSTRITAVRAADGRTLGSILTDLQPGKAYTVLFAGEAEYYVKGVLYEDN